MCVCVCSVSASRDFESFLVFDEIQIIYYLGGGLRNERWFIDQTANFSCHKQSTFLVIQIFQIFIYFYTYYTSIYT